MGILANDVQEHNGDFDDFGYNCNDFNSKASFEMSQSSSFSMNIYPPILPEKRCSWRLLPFGKFSFQPIRLCVLKLDGSSFDIIVTKKATVAKLKQAVEVAFDYLPKHGDGKVSWSHVWGQFCLCFEGQKLLRDRDSIVRYGIRNGDQLQFVRHMPHVNTLASERLENLTYDPNEAIGLSNDCSNQPNIVLNEINDGYVDFGANTKLQPKWGCTMRGLFSKRKAKGPTKRHGHAVNSTITLGRSFKHCELCAASSSDYSPKDNYRRGGSFKQDDTNISGTQEISRRLNVGSTRYGSCRRTNSSFSDFTADFGYPTGYCMK
ncbi:hypothetical protein OSB04_un001673 [Centaurea solstitialis]|uniref:SNRNP25 ubiquitin-like domain-containing protein n=1 Tax=Centaurea solstitialis TaxID=347529 RepID=A0AA38VQN9_9ASTR|nr:hypothetical protein OSB04_un001673 [Centaurea solstitialis]